MLLNERLIQKSKETKISQAEIARATGISTAAVSKWFSGENTPKAGSLKIIADLLGVSVEWLLTGKESRTNHLSNIKVWDEGSELEDDEVEIAFYKTLRLACGSGSMVQVSDSDKGFMRLPRKLLDKLGIYRDRTFSAPAEDDSMKPTINDGDIVYVDENRDFIKDGKIFAIEHGELFRCKRLYKTSDGGVRIVSDNKDEYPEEFLTKQQMEEQGFRIIGWVWKIDKVENW